MNNKKIFSYFLVVLILMMCITSQVFASATITGTTPNPTDIEDEYLAGSVDTTAVQQKVTNTTFASYQNASQTYYLVTGDSTRTGVTSVAFGGTTYPIADVCYATPSAGKVDLVDALTDCSIATNAAMPANSTFFFDSGTYNDSYVSGSVGGLYTRFASNYLSIVGLDSTDPAVFTKTAVSGAISRYYLGSTEYGYFENVVFDGEDNKIYSSASHGNTILMLSNGTTRVLRNVAIKNYASPTLTEAWSNGTSAVAINILNTSDIVLDAVTVENVGTYAGYGSVQIGSSSDVYLNDVNIIVRRSGGSETPVSNPIKIETSSAATNLPSVHINNLVTDGANKYVYIQDYGYTNVSMDSTYNYARFSTSNGSVYSSGINVYQVLPASANNYAYFDIEDNAWIIRAGESRTLTQQLTSLHDVLSRMAQHRTLSSDIYIKYVVGSEGVNHGITVPDFTSITGLSGAKVHIVPVQLVTDTISSSTMFTVGSSSSITLPTSNSGSVFLYNLNFHGDSNGLNGLNYTLQEVTAGITPLTPTDVHDSTGITGYPDYSTYAPASAVAEVYTNTVAANFRNCKFTSLVNSVSITPSSSTIGVGDNINLTAGFGTSPNSYTGLGVTGIDSTADNSTYLWHVVSGSAHINVLSPTTGSTLNIEAISVGTVTIKVKALDSYNDGEIEKPYTTITFTVNPEVEPPKTGVASDTSAWLGLLGLGLFGTVLLVSKRRNEVTEG